MGVFTRFRDIISSNVNAMLDKAEDPEKMIKLMIQEMEDTLVDLKASCAGAMASRTRVNRGLDQVQVRVSRWDAKARLAMEKAREDLAREALIEKRHLQDQLEAMQHEVDQFSELIDQYQKEIEQLEDKLTTTRNKHRILIQRHIHAHKRNKAQKNIRQVDTTDAFVRFDQFENRIDRMEAEADLVNPPKKPTLDDEFRKLEVHEDVERELARLRESVGAKS